MLADGELNSSEAAFLHDWLLRHAAYADRYPFNHLYARVSSALVDGVIDHDEEADLLGTLAEFVGGEAYDAASGATSRSTSLPFDDPPPEISYRRGESSFCVTGTFSYGDRDDVMRAILLSGGSIDNSVLKRTNYLVVGEFASPDWIHSNYGRKIERAIELRNEGQSIAIISESYWVSTLNV